MDAVVRSEPTSIIDLQSSGVSWAAIAAGGVAAAALTLLLIAFGAGLGLSSVSPWSDSGVAGSTFATGTGIYLVIVGVMASAVGGYLAARLRTKWTGIHTHEMFFRDTAHGLLAWAFATVISATVLGAATTHLVSGAAGGLAAAAPQAAQSIAPTDIATDKLFRSDMPAPAAERSRGRYRQIGNFAASPHQLSRHRRRQRGGSRLPRPARRRPDRPLPGRSREARERHDRRDQAGDRRCPPRCRQLRHVDGRRPAVRRLRGKPGRRRRRPAAGRNMEREAPGAADDLIVDATRANQCTCEIETAEPRPAGKPRRAFAAHRPSPFASLARSC